MNQEQFDTDLIGRIVADPDFMQRHARRYDAVTAWLTATPADKPDALAELEAVVREVGIA